MPRYIALLRGINVGGKNVITMADLRACFSDAGYGDVATYIQSGNVAFDSTERSGKRLATQVAKLLAEAFEYDATLVIRSAAQVRKAVAAAPQGFGSDPKTYRYDVAFLMPPLTPAAALGAVKLRDGVDRAWPGTALFYFSRLIAGASRSGFQKLSAHPLYQQMTIRNWNTTRKLLELVE